MLKNKSKKICLIFLVIVFLFKTSNIVEGNELFEKIQLSKKQNYNCTIKAVNSYSSIEISQQNKRFYVGTISLVPPIFPFIKFIAYLTAIILLCFLFIIDLRKYILRLISVYFNGSKYKEAGLLSAF